MWNNVPHHHIKKKIHVVESHITFLPQHAMTNLHVVGKKLSIYLFFIFFRQKCFDTNLNMIYMFVYSS
jgi:hypothetical protein